MCTDQHLLGRTGPPGLQGDAAERDPRLDDGGALDPQRGGGRDDREGVGGALANLEVAGMCRESSRLGRQTYGDDQLARFEHALALGRASGQTVEALERNLAAPRPALDLDHGVECDERDAEIGGVRRDAALAPPEHGMQPGVAAARLAPCAGLAFVADARNVVEVGASRALQEIAAYRC